MKIRFLFAASIISVLFCGLLSLPSRGATVTVIGPPARTAWMAWAGQAPMAGQAETRTLQQQHLRTQATQPTQPAGPVASVATVTPSAVLQEVTAELAATPSQPLPRVQPMARAMVPPVPLAQAVQVAQEARDFF